MFRVTKLDGIFHVIKIDSIENNIKDIKEFIDNNIPVIIVNDLDDLFDLDDSGKITIVTLEEDDE